MSFLWEDKHSVVIRLVNWKFIPFSTTLPPDLTITFKNMTICLHKSVLIERCPYFRMMLQSKYKESETSKVNIEFDVDVYIFHGILEYIRTGELVVPTKHIEAVYKCARYFMLDDLAQFCCKHFKQKIDCETVDNIHTLGKDNQFLEVSKAAMDFKEKHFEAIFKSRVFLKWSMESIEELLCSDLIKVANEKKVLMFVFEWLQFDLDERLKSADNLFRRIRYFYLTKQKMDEIAGSNENLGQVLSKIASEFSGKSMSPRIYYEGIYTLAVYEGIRGGKILKFQRYHPVDGSLKILQLPEPYTAKVEDRNLYVCNDKVYMITQQPDEFEPKKIKILKVQIYDPVEDSWTSGASTTYFFGMFNLLSCALEDNIYFINVYGGAHSSSVYCVSTNAWSSHRIPVEYDLAFRVGTCGDSIYLYSRLEKESKSYEIIQFNPSTLELNKIPWSTKFLDFEISKIIGYKSKLVFFSHGNEDNDYADDTLVVFDTNLKTYEEYKLSQRISLSSLTLFNDSFYILKRTDDDYTDVMDEIEDTDVVNDYDDVLEMVKVEIDFMDSKRNLAIIPQPNWKPFTGEYALITSIE